MPVHRASGCCSRAVAAAMKAPRLGWGTRRHSTTSAASVLGQQGPSEPQYPAASPQRHGTPQRHVIPWRHGIPQRFGIPQRHGIPWDGSDRSCHIPRPTIRRRTRQHGKRMWQGTSHASPRTPRFLLQLHQPPMRMSTEHRDDDLVSGAHAEENCAAAEGAGLPSAATASAKRGWEESESTLRRCASRCGSAVQS
jgi:hypothetical protein